MRRLGERIWNNQTSFNSVLLLLLLHVAHSQSHPLLSHKLDSLIQIGLDSQAYPGAQLFLSFNGEVVHHKAYGFHQYDKRIPVLLSDLYDLASISKVTTSLPLLMQLYGEGRFDPDATLATYLPIFANTDKAKISYREIMSHQGRLTPFIVFWREAQRNNCKWHKRTFKSKANRRYNNRIASSLYLHKDYKQKMLKRISTSQLRETNDYAYSDLPFILMPEVVESITGKKFKDQLYSKVYQAIGISRLVFNPHEHFPLREIVPTELDTFFRHELVHGFVHDEGAAMLGGVSGHAGLFGNAESVGKLFELYMCYGRYGDVQVIDSVAVREFTRYQYAEMGNRRGLGFDKPLFENHTDQSYVAKDASPSSFGHGGFTGTFVWADPETGIVMVLLTNRVNPTRANRKLYSLNLRPLLHQLAYDHLLHTD